MLPKNGPQKQKGVPKKKGELKSVQLFQQAVRYFSLPQMGDDFHPGFE